MDVEEVKQLVVSNYLPIKSFESTNTNTNNYIKLNWDKTLDLTNKL